MLLSCVFFSKYDVWDQRTETREIPFISLNYENIHHESALSLSLRTALCNHSSASSILIALYMMEQEDIDFERRQKFRLSLNPRDFQVNLRKKRKNEVHFFHIDIYCFGHR